METINFISEFKHYDNEESGIKPYTIRKAKKRLLNRVKIDTTKIRIQRGYTTKYFIKKITHIMYWEGYIIFAWNPNERL